MKARRLAAVGIAAALVGGCASGSASPSPAASQPASSSTAAAPSSAASAPASAEATKTVGVIFATFDSPFFVVIEQQIHSGAPSYSLNPLPTLSSDFDVTKEATDVRNLISQKVDVLILNPSDSAAVVPSLQAAQAANIPVVTFDTLPDSGKDFMSVRTDNIAMGASACDSLGSMVSSTAKVAEIQGDLANSGGRERAKGFEDCMAQKYPNIKILKVPAHWVADQAASGLDAIMTANPDLAGIYEHTGGGYLAPVQQVLQRHNKWIKAGQPGHMPFVSIDGEPIELQAIRDGYLDSTESQPADMYGKWSIFYARAALDGKTFSAGPTDHSSTIIAQPNGILEDSFPAIHVTKSNVDDPGLWGNTKASPSPSY